MFLIAVATFSICAAPAAATPSPAPLKVIQRVTITELCPALRENLAPAIIGLRTNAESQVASAITDIVNRCRGTP